MDCSYGRSGGAYPGLSEADLLPKIIFFAAMSNFCIPGTYWGKASVKQLKQKS
jgi:hypothetical protein